MLTKNNNKSYLLRPVLAKDNASDESTSEENSADENTSEKSDDEIWVPNFGFEFGGISTETNS